MNKRYAYDIETYKNMFLVGFIDIDDNNDDYISFGLDFFRNDLKELKSFLKKDITLFGYNSYEYDDLVLRFVLTTKNINNKKIYDFSKNIIENKEDMTKDIYRLRSQKHLYNTCDLFRIGNFNIGYSYSSLKEIGIRLNHDNVIDLPYKPTKLLTPNEMINIEEYNINDILITKKLYKSIEGKYKMRIALGKEYNENFLNSSDSNIANKIVTTMYSIKTGLNHSEFKNKRTQRDCIILKDIIPNINFKNNNIESFKNDLSKKSAYVDQNKIINKDDIINNITINKDLVVNFGLGGLHSVDKPNIFKSTDNLRLIDLDVTSYYPNIILNYEIYPEHLSKDLLDVIKDLTTQRIEAKKNKNKYKSDGLKIAINSIYGKFNFKDSWLFDTKCTLQVTFIGQFYLLLLIEMLIKNFEIISVNTDGITCKVYKDDYEKFKKIYKEWENISGFALEETEYTKYIRRDVNNYIAEKKDDDIKLKGIFVTENLNKSINAIIIKKALINYFLYDISIEDTIKNDKNNIFDYILYYKSNSQFKVYYDNQLLQKTNRWYISKTGKLIYKQRIDNLNIKTYNTPDMENCIKNKEIIQGQKIKLYGGESAKICNNIKNISVPNDINYNFYISETRNIINSIKNNSEQFNLF